MMADSNAQLSAGIHRFYDHRPPQIGGQGTIRRNLVLPRDIQSAGRAVLFEQLFVTGCCPPFFRSIKGEPQPFAQGFGWGAEINLRDTFAKLFSEPFGGGYPKERREPEQRNKKILDQVKKVTYKPLLTILKEIDQDFLKETISGSHFAEYFYPNCKDAEIANYLKSL